MCVNQVYRSQQILCYLMKYLLFQAIFEALEDTIYNLRQQLRERDAVLTSEKARCNEFRKKLHQILR